MAARQRGRVTWAQIDALGVPKSTVAAWLRDGYLHPRLPRVYAVGHAATSVEAELVEALLYAGPGATLSHATAAWWLGLLEDRPGQIHVSTSRQCRSLKAITVHSKRTCERIWHHGLPATTLAQTLLDFSVRAPLWSVRRVLAQADYNNILDLAAIDAVIGRGRAGSAKLRTALQRHRPELARTKSRLERLFFEICEDVGFPLPELNQYVAGWEIDVLWRDKQIAVELDGYGNHHTPAQLRRDRRKELELRAAGYTPARYSEEQLELRTDVVDDLRRLREAA